MTLNKKQALIAEIVTLLQAKLEVDIKAEIAETAKSAKPATDNIVVEMLTIKECAEFAKGLSEHSIRQLVTRGEIPHIRAGQGNRGKILISKMALLDYLNRVA